MVGSKTEGENTMNITRPGVLTIEDLLTEHFSGVPLLGTRVGLEEGAENYNHKLLTYLYSVADYLDTQTEDGRTWLEKFVPYVFSKELFFYDEVVEQQNKYINALKALAENPQGDKKIVFALPMHGAFPIADQLVETFTDKIFPINISGSLGTTTGTAQVHGELPEDILDENNTVVFADDVGDTFITAAQLAMKRRERRLDIKKEDYMKDEYAQKIKLIQDLRDQTKDKSADIAQINKDLIEQYSLLTPLFQEENIVIATLYSKNKPVFETLTKLADASTTNETAQWINIQKRLLKVCTEISEDDWIVGGRGDWNYPLLDTKIKGLDILEKIPEKHRKLLETMGLARLSLRIGAGVGSLKIFNPAKQEELLQLIADLIMAEYFKENLEPSD